MDVIKAAISKLLRLKSLNFGVRKIEVATSPKIKKWAILSSENWKPKSGVAKFCEPEIIKITMASKTGQM